MLLDKVYKKLRELGLDGVLISNQTNITYLTKFFSRESYLLLSNTSIPSPGSAGDNLKFVKGALGITPGQRQGAKKRNFFITDFRYLYEAKRNLKGFLIKKINGSVFNLISGLAARLQLKRLGFEAKHLCFAEHEKIKEGLPYGLELVPTYDLIESFRQIKTETELKKIKKAIKITEQAFKYVRTIIRPGIRENELTDQLEDFIKGKGASGLSFDIIVASGANSSFPHHITSKRRLKNREVLLIDMGVSFQGYKSDLTRVFFLGKITPIIRRIYNIVLRAQEAAIKGIKPGVPISKIDRTARQYITRKGFGRYFGHSLGHGIGLEVHEDPHISLKNNNLLMKNSLFTIEPAIYLPGKFGIRIEDIVLVTSRGVEVLSDNLDKSI